jgi:N utilization substance protein A
MSESRYSETMEVGYESLVQLPGVGVSMADALYEKGFFSVEELSNAAVEDLIQIRGIGNDKASKLIEAAIAAVAESRAAEETGDTAAEELETNETPGEDSAITDPAADEGPPPEPGPGDDEEPSPRELSAGEEKTET